MAARRRRERERVGGEGRSDGVTRWEGRWEEERGVGRRRAWEREREEEEAMVVTDMAEERGGGSPAGREGGAEKNRV